MTHNGLGRADVVRCWAGFASLGAGLVHFAVTREHVTEWWLYGVFFAVVGAAQVLWAIAALAATGRAPHWRVVAAGNLALVLLWLVTRTTGLPVGPEPWAAEPVGTADVLCVVLELGVSGLLLLAGSRRLATARAGRHAVGRFVALMFAGALGVSAITTPALAATDAGAHAHHHMGGHG